MKRILTIVLSLVLIFVLAACGGPSGGELQEPSHVETGSPEPGRTEPPKGDQQDSPTPEQTAGTEGAGITETVLVDEAGVKITAKSLDMDSLFGPEVKLLIENNSGQDLTFQTRNSAVNGYMVETMISVDVVNGKKANDGLIIMGSDLELCGITEIADLEFSFHIFTTEDWETYLDTSVVRLETSLAEGYEYRYDDSGHLAYENGGIKVVVKGLAADQSIFGPSIVVYLENNSAGDITVQVRDISVNGFMVDALFSSNVMAGKRAVDTITFLSDDLEENGITDITEVELSFHIFDEESWETITDTEAITIEF